MTNLKIPGTTALKSFGVPKWKLFLAQYSICPKGINDLKRRKELTLKAINRAKQVMYSDTPQSKRSFDRCWRVIEKVSKWLPSVRGELLSFAHDALSRNTAQLSNLTSGRVSREEIDQVI